jgi:hypothetical protein
VKIMGEPISRIQLVARGRHGAANLASRTPSQAGPRAARVAPVSGLEPV